VRRHHFANVVVVVAVQIAVVPSLGHRCVWRYWTFVVVVVDALVVAADVVGQPVQLVVVERKT